MENIIAKAKLNPKKNGSGYIGYELSIGATQARQAGLVDENGTPRELEKIIIPNSGIAIRRKKMYTLRYGTGAGDTTHETIEEALAAVSPSYTQQSVYLVDENEGEELYILPWIPFPYDPEGDEDIHDEEPHTDFGRYGYYAPWRECHH